MENTENKQITIGTNLYTDISKVPTTGTWI